MLNSQTEQLITPEEEDDAISEALLGWIDNFAPHGVIATDREFRIRSWNKWMETHSNLTAESVMDRVIFDIYPELEQRNLTPRFHRALAGQVSFLSTALHGYLLPLPPVSKEKGSYDLMQQTARIGPLVAEDQVCGVIVLIEDVTQRERQAAILRHQHEHERILSWALGHLLTTSDPVKTIRELFCKVAEQLDFDSYFLYLNKGHHAVLDLQDCGGIPAEMREHVATIPMEQPSWMLPQLAVALNVVENVHRSTDTIYGVPRQLGIGAYVSLPLKFAGESLGALCFGSRSRQTLREAEVTLVATLSQYLAVALSREKTERELRKAQEALAEHSHTLEKQVADRTSKLRENIAELETFSYTVAHDLRAPIRALTGYTDVLIEDFGSILPPDAHVIINKLGLSAKRLDDLTRDLLEFSKLSRDDVILSSVSLDELIPGLLASMTKSKDCITFAKPLGSVCGHATLLQQAIGNLLENAIKFVECGNNPKVKVWTEAVTGPHVAQTTNTSPFSRAHYSTEPRAALPLDNRPRVRIYVEDGGIGIMPEAQGRIFGIFERGAITSEFEGTGIGLALVTRAVERMGGTCGVTSKPGVGSKFWLELAQSAEAAS